MVILCLILWRTTRLFSKSTTPVFISTRSIWGFQFFTLSPTVVSLIIAILAVAKLHLIGFFNFYIIFNCSWHTLCGFDLHFSLWLIVLNIFFCVHIGHFSVFFWDTSIHILGPLLNQVVFLLLSCKSDLYFLDTLSDIWLAKFFFHSMGSFHFFKGWVLKAAGDILLALAGVAQWIMCQPANQRVASLISSQGTCLGCGPGHQLGMQKRQPHINVSLLLSPSLPLCLKINKYNLF